MLTTAEQEYLWLISRGRCEKETSDTGRLDANAEGYF
jgi:hypothetical protein